MATAEKIAPGLRSMTVPVEGLSEDPTNARKHGPRNLEAIKASLEKFGQQKPIVVNRGMVVAGNGTLAAAVDLGWENIAVTSTDLKGVAAKAYAIADNRTAELAEWDDVILAETLADMELEDFDLVAASGWLKDEVAGSALDEAVDAVLGDLEYRVIVSIETEETQANLIEELEGRGYKCQALMS